MSYIKNFNQYLLESNVAESDFWKTAENNLFWIWDSWFPKVSISDHVFLTLYAHNYKCPFIVFYERKRLPMDASDFEDDGYFEEGDRLEPIEINDYSFSLYHDHRDELKTLRDELGLPETPEWKKMDHEIDVSLEGLIEPDGVWREGHRGDYYTPPDYGGWEIYGIERYLYYIKTDEQEKEMEIQTYVDPVSKDFSVKVLSCTFKISHDSGYDAQSIAQLGYWGFCGLKKGKIPQKLIDKILKVLTEEDYMVLVYGIIKNKVNRNILRIFPKEYATEEFISFVNKNFKR